MKCLSFPSPVGDLTVFQDDNAIVALEWGWAGFQEPSPLLLAAKNHLAAYFNGDGQDCQLPMRPKGTPFQQKVWNALCAIPYGHAATYHGLADYVGSHARAVGTACGANPIPILIPCHRVLGADGDLVGYKGEGGLETKALLLRHEGALFKDQLSFFSFLDSAAS